MIKYDALIITGKLEVRHEGYNQVIDEIKNMQKYIAEDDFVNVAVSIGKLKELGITSEAKEDLNELYKYVIKNDISKATGDTCKADPSMRIERMNLSPRCYNAIKRPSEKGMKPINTLGEMLDFIKEFGTIRRLNKIGQLCSIQIYEKLEELGYGDFLQDYAGDYSFFK